MCLNFQDKDSLNQREFLIYLYYILTITPILYIVIDLGASDHILFLRQIKHICTLYSAEYYIVINEPIIEKKDDFDKIKSNVSEILRVSVIDEAEVAEHLENKCKDLIEEEIYINEPNKILSILKGGYISKNLGNDTVIIKMEEEIKAREIYLSFTGDINQLKNRIESVIFDCKFLIVDQRNIFTNITNDQNKYKEVFPIMVNTLQLSSLLNNYKISSLIEQTSEIISRRQFLITNSDSFQASVHLLFYEEIELIVFLKNPNKPGKVYLIFNSTLRSTDIFINLMTSDLSILKTGPITHLQDSRNIQYFIFLEGLNQFKDDFSDDIEEIIQSIDNLPLHRVNPLVIRKSTNLMLQKITYEARKGKI